MPVAAVARGFRRVEHVMGMPVVVDIRDEAVDDDLLDRMFDCLRFADATFSTYKAGSEISRLNRGELAVAAHPDVRDVLDRCEELRLETDGYFDVRAADPAVVDPSGLVKGWAVDRATSLLIDAGLCNFAVNVAGDMRLRGRAVPEVCWSVGIQHPLEPRCIAAVVEANDLAIATSGAYARGGHVIDPHTRRPPSGVLSVTSGGPGLATADAYATAAFAMGEAGIHWTARLRGYEAMTILADERVLSTPGFPAAR